MEEQKPRAAAPDPGVFLNVFKATHIGIAVEDLEGRPLFANPALCSMLGFSEEEMRNKHCVEFSPPEDAQKDWALFEQLRAGLIDHYELEKRFFRRDGTLIRGRLSISLVGSGKSQLVVAMVEDLTTKNASETLRPEPPLEQLRHIVQARDEERSSFTRALRDYIESLTVVSIDLDRCEQGLPESAASSRPEILDIRQQVRKLITDIGTFYGNLHSSILEYLGLTQAAASFCRHLAQKQNVHIGFDYDSTVDEIPKDISVCLYRVLQEALQNAVQHSGSQQLEVSLRLASDNVSLVVRDWGVGFDSEEIMKKPGLGLITIQEHLKLVAGEFFIQSGRNRGTTVEARVPFSH